MKSKMKYIILEKGKIKSEIINCGGKND